MKIYFMFNEHSTEDVNWIILAQNDDIAKGDSFSSILSLWNRNIYDTIVYCNSIPMISVYNNINQSQIDGLVQERRNSIAKALE